MKAKPKAGMTRQRTPAKVRPAVDAEMGTDDCPACGRTVQEPILSGAEEWETVCPHCRAKLLVQRVAYIVLVEVR